MTILLQKVWSAHPLIRQSDSGKPRTTQEQGDYSIISGDGMLLTSTLDIARRWKEYTEDLLNPTVTPSIMEADPGDEGDPCLSLGVRSLMQLNKCSRRGVCSNCRGSQSSAKTFVPGYQRRELNLKVDSEAKVWFLSLRIAYLFQHHMVAQYTPVYGM